jgi:hypothetical protein
MSANRQTAAGVTVPDTKLAGDATELVRTSTTDLVYHHSRRVFWFGSLQGHGVPEDSIRRVWTAIALHTTPGVPEFMEPEVALVTAGVEYDVLGIGYHDVSDADRAKIVALHPHPGFKRNILEAFTEGMAPKPETTFGTVNADVLERFVSGYQRANFVDIIEDSDWPE